MCVWDNYGDVSDWSRSFFLKRESERRWSARGRGERGKRRNTDLSCVTASLSDILERANESCLWNNSRSPSLYTRTLFPSILLHSSSLKKKVESSQQITNDLMNDSAIINRVRTRRFRDNHHRRRQVHFRSILYRSESWGRCVLTKIIWPGW